MSSTALCAILFVAALQPAGAQDWETWAARSDRTMDPIFVDALEKGNLEVGISICKGLARRSDLDIQAEMDLLLSLRSPALPPANCEVMLRWLLAASEQAHPGDDALRAWADANAPQVRQMLERVQRWKDPQLKDALLALAVIAPGSLGTGAIFEVGAQVVQSLQDAPGGLLSAQETALALDFLAVARKTRSPAFFDLCVEAARLSRDKGVVDAARAAARELAAPP
ncbi:MAG TPA: hypothetical protein VMF68_13850 [Spirochaetia bacterium]|nr:hypothetical protein [Spirochaetia bacterium]